MPGKVMAADVDKLDEAETVEGSKVKITLKGQKIMICNASFVKPEIVCKNGVIHSIDSVILPE